MQVSPIRNSEASLLLAVVVAVHVLASGEDILVEAVGSVEVTEQLVYVDQGFNRDAGHGADRTGSGDTRRRGR